MFTGGKVNENFIRALFFRMNKSYILFARFPVCVYYLQGKGIAGRSQSLCISVGGVDWKSFQVQYIAELKICTDSFLFVNKL